jgi:hypothetical protein
MTDVSGQLPSIPEFIAAAGALGTAAYGLVDASKFIAGGMSNPGFGFIRKAVRPLLGAAGDYGPEQILATLKANWLNGMAKADQKAVAKSLIRLGLTSGKAELLAKATGVDAGALGDGGQVRSERHGTHCHGHECAWPLRRGRQRDPRSGL